MTVTEAQAIVFHLPLGKDTFQWPQIQSRYKQSSTPFVYVRNLPAFSMKHNYDVHPVKLTCIYN
jgi:hypothetical protein